MIKHKLLLTSARRFAANLTSLRPRLAGPHYRLYAMPGDEILAKEVVAKQHTFKWHPGLNVGIDKKRTLYALRDGILVISEELFDPDWEHPIVQQVYMQKGEKLAPPYARYLNIIPKHRNPEFKLVDAV